jgi:hypothetical protein
MSLQGIYSGGARLLGIYFLVDGLSLLPTAYAAAIAASSVADEVGVPFGNAFALASTAQALVLVVAGVILLLWKRSGPIAVSIEPTQVMAVGLKLLGAFFIVSGASNVIWGIMRGSLAPDFAFTNYSKAFAGSFALAAGLVLWFRARALSGLPTNG